MEKVALVGALDVHMRSLIEGLLPEGFRTEYVPTPAEYDRLRDADYIVVRTVSIRADAIATLTRTKLIQRWGVGYDIIDIEAAGAKNIPVAVMSGINAIQVAELAVMLMLAVYRNLIPLHNGFMEGKWLKAEYIDRSFMISGKTIGLVGFGNIGRKVARRVKAFGAEVLYHDVIRPGMKVEEELGVSYAPLDHLFKTADIVSLHVPLSGATRGLIDRNAIELMKPTAVVINTSRGGVVNQADLVAALGNGRLLGAGLDVYESEPLKENHPFSSLKNVVITPHVGGNTVDNNPVMARRAVDNIVRVSKGLPVNAEDLVNAQFLGK
jgi:D-3-phosphoglycerate dehydrogenase / 2-oxoglutarate reductase